MQEIRQHEVEHLRDRSVSKFEPQHAEHKDEIQEIRGPNLQTAANDEAPDVQSRFGAQFLEQQTTDQEPAEHEEQVDATPAEALPDAGGHAEPSRFGWNDHRMAADDEQDRDA